MALRPPGTPLDCSSQSSPPSVVWRMTPLSPAAHPSSDEIIEIARMLSVLANSCSYQLTPPLVVCRTVPYSPTAQPLEALMNCTSRRELPWGMGDCQFHSALRGTGARRSI